MNKRSKYEIFGLFFFLIDFFLILPLFRTMAEPEFMQMGKSFVGFYYPAFANDRAQLANVYTDQVKGFVAETRKQV